jgi:cytochrome c553
VLKKLVIARVAVTWCSGLLLLAVSMAQAAENGGQFSERDRLMAEIKKELHNDEAHKAAITAGKERTVLCSNCHGIDGNSVQGDIPNLAGQNPAYIIEQLDKFFQGARKNFVMQTLASVFTFKDKVNLAVYYTSQKVKPQGFDARLAEKGRTIYKSVCFRCHGEDGKGEEGYARLAGQKIDYVKMTLKRFRAIATRTADEYDIKRTNVNMEQVTVFLSDEDIEGLANYIASLR